MVIHFICTGNIYRSRMAEAYCVSRCVPGVSVLSSGTQTVLNGGVSIARYAAETLRAHGLEHFASASWKQTTPALVRQSDILVFMEDEHHRFCLDWIDPRRQRVQIWGVHDIGSGAKPAEFRAAAERTFATLKAHTDLLLAGLP